MNNSEQAPRPKIELETAEGLRATVNPEGGFVESLISSDGKELLFPRQDIDGKNRGGIPVCAPVFGLAKDIGLEPHGFARKQMWLTEIMDPERIILSLVNPIAQDQKIPKQYEGCAMELEVCIKSEAAGNSLGMFLRVRNEGDQAFVLTPGFHPYFPVPDGMLAGDIRISSGGRTTQFTGYELEEAATLKREESEPITFSDGIHAISVASENVPVPVVWSGDPKKYYCVEPTAMGPINEMLPEELEALSLQPGDSTAYSMTITWQRPQK